MGEGQKTGGAFLEHQNYLGGIFDVPKAPRTFENTTFS